MIESSQTQFEIDRQAPVDGASNRFVERHPDARLPARPVLREPLSIEQYHKLIDAGVLNDDDRVELLDGWLVETMPKNPPHRIATRLMQKALERIVPPGWYVDAQEPITLEASEPEPDVVIARGDTLQYRNRHPGPMDVALVVEIADATLLRDRTLKKNLYAAAGIPVYWIVNLVAGMLEVYSTPMGQGVDADYTQRRDYGLADEAPLILEGREVGRLRVGDLLPPVIQP